MRLPQCLWLQNWKPKRIRRRHPASVCPAVEELEARTLMSTVQGFDSLGLGSPYTLAQFIEGPAPVLLSGGPTGGGKFLRLVSATPTPPSHNTITFGRTDAGTFGRIVADFDFRMTPGNGRADGFGFTLLNTAHYPAGAVGGRRGRAQLHRVAGGRIRHLPE